MQALGYLKFLNSAKPNLAWNWRSRINIAGIHGLTFLHTVHWHKELNIYWPMTNWNWTSNSAIQVMFTKSQ